MFYSCVQYILFFGVVALSVVFTTTISAHSDPGESCRQGCIQDHKTQNQLDSVLNADQARCIISECTTSLDATLVDLESVDIDAGIVAPDTNASLSSEETQQSCEVLFNADDPLVRGNLGNNNQQCMESDLGIDPPPTIEPQQSLLTQALAQCNKSGVQSLSRDEVLALVDKVSEFSEKDCELLSLYATFKTIRNWLFFIAGFLGLSAIIFAGFLWIISRNEEKKLARAKKFLLSALFGFTLVLISGSILQILMALLG